MNDRRDVCVDWSEDRMNAYLKHQASLERKRRSKSKQKSKKESVPDFSTVCTGIQGTDDVSDDGATRGGAVVDSASSAAGSASRQEVEDIVSEKFLELGQQLRSSISSDVGVQLNQFGENIVILINQMQEQNRSNNVSNDSSLSAPRQVPGPSVNDQVTPPLSNLHHGSESHGASRDGRA